MALSSVEKKMKATGDRYLFAVELVPVSETPIAELTDASDAEATPNPFEKAPTEVPTAVESYDDCWFCYDNPKVVFAFIISLKLTLSYSNTLPAT